MKAVRIALVITAIALAAKASAAGGDPDVRKGEVYGTPYSNDTQRKIRRELEIARQIDRDRQQRESARRAYRYEREENSRDFRDPR
jgi:hypothetical protein